MFLLSRAAFVPFGLCLPVGSGYRVVTAASPRMAPCEPPERQPQPLQRPVFTQCFEGILRAGRREAARRRRERGDAELVELHQRDQRQGADAFKGVPRLFPESGGLHFEWFYRAAPLSRSRSAPGRGSPGCRSSTSVSATGMPPWYGVAASCVCWPACGISWARRTIPRPKLSRRPRRTRRTGTGR